VKAPESMSFGSTERVDKEDSSVMGPNTSRRAAEGEVLISPL